MVLHTSPDVTKELANVQDAINRHKYRLPKPDQPEHASKDPKEWQLEQADPFNIDKNRTLSE